MKQLKYIYTLLFVAISFFASAQACQKCQIKISYEDCILSVKQLGADDYVIQPDYYIVDQGDKIITFYKDGEAFPVSFNKIVIPDFDTFLDFKNYVEEQYCGECCPPDTSLNELIEGVVTECDGEDAFRVALCNDTLQIGNLPDTFQVNITNTPIEVEIGDTVSVLIENDSIRVFGTVEVEGMGQLLEIASNILIELEKPDTVTVENEVFVKDTSTHILLDSLLTVLGKDSFECKEKQVDFFTGDFSGQTGVFEDCESFTAQFTGCLEDISGYITINGDQKADGWGWQTGTQHKFKRIEIDATTAVGLKVDAVGCKGMVECVPCDCVSVENEIKCEETPTAAVNVFQTSDTGNSIDNIDCYFTTQKADGSSADASDCIELTLSFDDEGTIISTDTYSLTWGDASTLTAACNAYGLTGGTVNFNTSGIIELVGWAKNVPTGSPAIPDPNLAYDIVFDLKMIEGCGSCESESNNNIKSEFIFLGENSSRQASTVSVETDPNFGVGVGTDSRFNFEGFNWVSNNMSDHYISIDYYVFSGSDSYRGQQIRLVGYETQCSGFQSISGGLHTLTSAGNYTNRASDLFNNYLPTQLPVVADFQSLPPWLVGIAVWGVDYANNLIVGYANNRCDNLKRVYFKFESGANQEIVRFDFINYSR